ncbi:MAG: IPT/TIG domain-containing protein [Vicinamibacteria bacterium]
MRRRARVRRATAAVAAAVVLGAGTFLVSAWMASGPAVVVVTPPRLNRASRCRSPAGGFADVAASNVVWFGGIAESPSSSTGDTPTRGSPPRPCPATWRSSSRRREAFAARRLPRCRSWRAESLEPEGGLPGEEVVLRGQGFGPGAVVSVGRAAAEIVSVEPHAIRFRVPAVSAPDGARVPLVATVAGRSAPPVPIVLGRLPRVESVEPPQAAAGEIVRLRGVAFAADPDANAVTFDGVGAVVVAASRKELAVVVPVVTRPQAEVPASLVVQARGRSSEARPYPILRLVDGAFVPRCILHVAVDGAGGGPLLVGSQLGPLMLLASRDEAESPRRALGTCARLTAALDRACSPASRCPSRRERTTGGVGVGLPGRPEMIERVTAEDAAAYQRPPGLPPRREAPEPEAVAYAAVGRASTISWPSRRAAGRPRPRRRCRRRPGRPSPTCARPCPGTSGRACRTPGSPLCARTCAGDCARPRSASPDGGWPGRGAS